MGKISEGARAMANYELQCERCDRPAEQEKRLVDWKEGQPDVRIVMKKDCDCGSKIVPKLD